MRSSLLASGHLRRPEFSARVNPLLARPAPTRLAEMQRRVFVGQLLIERLKKMAFNQRLQQAQE